jgi:hypothetical protein
MIENLAAVISLAVAYGVAVLLSRTFFGNAHEGFRILYHWFASAEYVPSDVEPSEPRVSVSSQVVFAVAVGGVLLASFPCARYWLSKALE